MSYLTRILWTASLSLLAFTAALPAQQTTSTVTSQPIHPIDPAAILPPDTFAYAEISNPGESMEQFLKLLADGGIADPMQMLMQKMQPTSQPTSGPQTAMPMPFAMMLNPSLVNEIKKIEGFAVGLSGFEVEQRPNYRSTEGKVLAVLYPGQSDAIRGIVQMLLAMGTKSTETYGSAMIYKLSDSTRPSTPYAAVTPRAILIGMPKKMVTDAIDRLNNPHADSLAGQSRFQSFAGKYRKNSALLVYADMDALFRSVTGTMTQRDRNEFAKMDQLLGLSAFDQACLRYTLTSDGLATELSASFKDRQTCAVYDLVRTPPADRSLLTYVPADAIGAFTLASGDGSACLDRVISFMNMASTIDKHAKATTRPAVEEAIAKVEKELGISIRNDLAGNIENIALAMLPPDMAKLSGNDKSNMPGEMMKMVLASNVYMIVKAKDAAQFDRTLGTLMDTMVSKLAKGQDAQATVTEESLDGGLLRVYAIPRSPVVPIIAKVDRTYILAIDKATAKAALAAHAGTRPNITTDGPSRKAIASIPDNASKIAAIRLDLVAGLFLKMAAGNQKTPVPSLPTMQPMTFYTVEEDQKMIACGEVRDIPKMIATGMQLYSTGVLNTLAPSPRVTQATTLVDRISPLARASGDGVAKAIAIAASADIHNGTLAPIELLICGEYSLLGGQKDRAIASIKKAIEQGGKEPYYHKSLGWALLSAGNAAEAKKAFQTAIKGMGDWSDKNAVAANIDGWTAAYFLDLVSPQEYAIRWQNETYIAGLPWFYIGQRMEIEGNKDHAIKAYRKSIELGKHNNAHYISNWAAYRVNVLTKASSGPTAQPVSVSASK